jgi:hypothetical protein
MARFKSFPVKELYTLLILLEFEVMGSLSCLQRMLAAD